MAESTPGEDLATYSHNTAGPRLFTSSLSTSDSTRKSRGWDHTGDCDKGDNGRGETSTPKRPHDTSFRAPLYADSFTTRHTRRGHTREISMSVDNNIRKTCQTCGGSKMAAAARHGTVRAGSRASGEKSLNARATIDTNSATTAAFIPYQFQVMPRAKYATSERSCHVARTSRALCNITCTPTMYFPREQFPFSEATFSYLAPCRASNAAKGDARRSAIFSLSDSSLHSVNYPTFESKIFPIIIRMSFRSSNKGPSIKSIVSLKP